MHISFNCNGRLLASDRPIIMGIINLTDDSFYSGSRSGSIDVTLQKVEKMLTDGASIIDIGAMSSRPGAKISSPESELTRLIPTIHTILTEFPDTILSIDTIHSSVANQCMLAGVSMINDISAGTYDPSMMNTVSAAGVPYIMMHMQGLPQVMQQNPSYKEVTYDVMKYFVGRVAAAQKAGITDIIIDPGFGFGKTVEHNYSLLKKLEVFQIFDLPVMVGLSRKSMIYRPLNIDASQSLNGSTALHMYALLKGASILRVHDVKEAAECIALSQMLR
ncbi:MAG: dihydropteroate synthase [Saprospiraceae bacterium]